MKNAIYIVLIGALLLVCYGAFSFIMETFAPEYSNPTNGELIRSVEPKGFPWTTGQDAKEAEINKTNSEANLNNANAKAILDISGAQATAIVKLSDAQAEQIKHETHQTEETYIGGLALVWICVRAILILGGMILVFAWLSGKL